MRRRLVLTFVSAPLTRLLSHSSLLSPIPCSLDDNDIGPKGASALAAVLKETMISNLKCAAAPAKCSFVSAHPLTHKSEHVPPFFCTLPPVSESEHVPFPNTNSLLGP